MLKKDKEWKQQLKDLEYYENGIMGLALGIFDLTSAGISVAVVMAFILAILFKPKH